MVMILAVLALLPLAAFAFGLRLTRRYLPAILIAGLMGASMGAFLATAGSAMASAVHPRTAAIRGGGIGFAGGAAVGGLATLAVMLWRRRARGVAP
jgi:hypothetical protein